MKKIYYLLMLAALTLGVTSCDDWDSPYYVDEIVGSWESSYGYNGYYEYDIYGYDVVRYDFYSNYTGRWTYYDSYMGLSYIDFDWETYGDRLYIRYYDGDVDFLYYGFDHNGYLIMALDRHFRQYTAYRPSGYYWEQFKDNALKQGLEVKKGTSKPANKEIASAKE
jgi:hypothetical protein